MEQEAREREKNKTPNSSPSSGAESSKFTKCMDVWFHHHMTFSHHLFAHAVNPFRRRSNIGHHAGAVSSPGGVHLAAGHVFLLRLDADALRHLHSQ